MTFMTIFSNTLKNGRREKAINVLSIKKIVNVDSIKIAFDTSRGEKKRGEGKREQREK